MSRSRLFFTGIILLFLLGAGAAWILSSQGIIQNSWASPLGTTFSVLGVLVAFVQWTLPLPSSETKASVPSAESGYAQEILLKRIYDQLTEANGALIVYEKRKHVGKNIRVSPDSSSSSDDDKEVNIVERTANGQPLFAAVFLNLKPDRYRVSEIWSYSRESITVHPGEIAELDWRRDIEKEEKETRKQQRTLTALRLNSLLIAGGGVLFFAHRYMMIPYLDIVGIVGAGLGVVNLLSVFFLGWLGFFEKDTRDYYTIRVYLFLTELGAALFLVHRYLRVPYLDIVGIIFMAYCGICFFACLFAFATG